MKYPFDELRKENERLKAAIMWALGDEGSDFGDHKPDNAPPFWWRTELRARAFGNHRVHKATEHTS